MPTQNSIMKYILSSLLILTSVGLFAQTETEPNGSFDTADPVVLRTTISGSINPFNDLDYYQFNIPQAGVIELFVNNVPSNIDMDMRLYNPDQVEIANAFGNNGDNVSINRLVCTPGTYYVLLTDNESNDGQYNLSVQLNTDDVYECNNSFNTATPLAFGSTIQASINSFNDADYYALTVTTPGVIDVFVNNVPANIDMDLILYDANQVQISSDFGGNGENVSVVRLVCDPGTYYVLLTENESNSGLYNLTVNFDATDIYECNNSFNDAAAINFDVNINGSIRNSNDLDYFALDVAEPGVINVFVNNVPSNIDMDLYLYNPDQIQLASDFGNNGQNVSVNRLVCEPGTYYVLLTDDESSANQYNMLATFNGEDIYECNNSFDDAFPINTGDTLRPQINSDGDLDYFALEITEPGIVNIPVSNIPSGMNLRVSLYNENQTLISNENNNSSFTYNQKICEAGTYYILIADISNGTDQSASPYQAIINYNTDDIYECNDSFDDAADIAINSTINAQINSVGDRDYFVFDVTEVGTVIPSISDIPPGMNLRAYLYDENQSLLEQANDNDPFLFTHTLCLAGRYYIMVEDVSTGNDESAEPYSLELGFDTQDEYECNNSFLTATPIDCGTQLRASILDNDDIDLYRFEIATEAEIIINITDVPTNIGLDILLYNEAQTIIGQRFGSQGEAQEIVLDDYQPGVYYLSLGDQGPTSSTDLYTLDLACDNISSTPETLLSHLNIYPNPASEVIFIEGLQQSVNYRICDVNGRRIAGGPVTENSIDLSTVNSGVYFVTIYNDQGIFTRRIVKQ